MLWVQVLENNVEGSARNAEKVAGQGMVVGHDGSAFTPRFLLFEMSHRGL